jgi:hypothetical protein
METSYPRIVSLVEDFDKKFNARYVAKKIFADVKGKDTDILIDNIKDKILPCIMSLSDKQKNDMLSGELRGERLKDAIKDNLRATEKDRSASSSSSSTSTGISYMTSLTSAPLAASALSSSSSSSASSAATIPTAVALSSSSSSASFGAVAAVTRAPEVSLMSLSAASSSSSSSSATPVVAEPSFASRITSGRNATDSLTQLATKKRSASDASMPEGSKRAR